MDLSTLENFLSQGADPNLVVNGSHIFIYFWERNKTNLTAHLLPLCDFNQRFSRGRCLLGVATSALVERLRKGTSEDLFKSTRLFQDFIEHGADPNMICQTDLVSLRSPCVDILFDALLSNQNPEKNMGTFLCDLLDRGVYPQNDTYWSNRGANLDQPRMPSHFPLHFNRWWSQMQNIRQRERIETELEHNHAASTPKRKI